MPTQPAKSWCSIPSRSVRCAARNRTIACATVSRTVLPAVSKPGPEFSAVSSQAPDSTWYFPAGIPGAVRCCATPAVRCLRSCPHVVRSCPPMLSREIVDSLFPSGLPEPEHWEQRYPPRDLPEGAQVTRFAPSPTGFLHIGGVYAATLDVDVARHSGGVYLVRLEDTDQARVEQGAAALFAEAFAYFSIAPDEDDRTGRYAPYSQSARAQTYLTFATKQDLAEITTRQRAAGALPGYYGQWAIWREADPDRVTERLAAGAPYVVRFRSPAVSGARVSFTDAIRGELTMDDNRNDVVILKSSDSELRLPTYHFAHAVDDHLMRVSLVLRGEEWLSSVPLHHQLFDALGFARVQYAHIAQLMKQDGGSRRKLSKRKDA